MGAGFDFNPNDWMWPNAPSRRGAAWGGPVFCGKGGVFLYATFVNIFVYYSTCSVYIYIYIYTDIHTHINIDMKIAYQ